MPPTWPYLIFSQVEASLAADRWEAGIDRLDASIEAQPEQQGRHALRERPSPSPRPGER